MKGFCTRSIPTITTLRLMDFLKSFSTSLNSSESLDNDTRWYCLLDSMEDQWFGVLVTLVFLLCWTLTAFWDLMKKMVMQCGQCKTQTADYFFHHANVNMRTIVPLFSSPKNNSPQSVRSLHFYTAPMQWHIVLNFFLLRMFQRIIQWIYSK